jgi:cysteine-rich repeat protein
MKITIATATFLVVGAGAAGAGALTLPNPYQGSDTLFNVTRQSLTSIGLTAADYVGGGSGNGESAMALVPPTQTTSPMSRMMKGGGVCGFGGGTNGTGATHASGIVVGLDAVDILGSTNSAASATCGGGSAGGNGILNSGGSISASTWKDALALVYGGKDNQTGKVDCNQTSRVNLVSKWSQLFQNASCTNGVAACGDGNHNGDTGSTGVVDGTVALWHAYRRDETSGTSDVFSSILGLSPSTSSSALNGFGTSPFCNAMNWDTTTQNAGTCVNTASGTFKPHSQFTGPGGVPDSVDPTHRMPPPGLNGLQVWGSAPDPSQTYKGSAVAWDVLPTQMQDNDPIRRACFGGQVTVTGHIGEDVCNIDGSLGLVLPLVDTDFVATIADPVHSSKTLDQYPPVATQQCGSLINGAAPNVFTCAPHNDFHPGECPNGDVAGQVCAYPIAGKKAPLDGFGQCVASAATVQSGTARVAAGNADGRIYNLFMTSGSNVDGAITLIQQNIPALGITLDFAGGYNRIHAVDVTASGETPCQMVDMTDQIGCLGQADPCSIGYAGDGGKLWNSHAAAPGGPTNPASPGIDAVNIYGVYPQTSSVQALGEKTEYPLSRKLYFNTMAGFSTVTSDELTLAKFEAGGSGGTTPFDTIITNNGFFPLGVQAGPPASGQLGVVGGTANTQFCEDFDEQTVCNGKATTACSASTPCATGFTCSGTTGFCELTATNVNACSGNPTGIPTASTICGNGTQEAYEECDDGPANGITGDKCSTTCRCTTFLDQTTGVCH